MFNPSVTDVEEQVSDMIEAKDAVVSGELTVAIRDTVISGVDVKAGQHIGILDGDLVSSCEDVVDALCEMIEKIDDLDMRELITLFIGAGVTDEQRAHVTEALEERFDEMSVEVYLGDQEVYDYLIAVE